MVRSTIMIDYGVTKNVVDLCMMIIGRDDWYIFKCSFRIYF